MRQLLLYSTTGVLIWTGILTGASHAVKSHYARAAQFADPVLEAVLIDLLGWYLYEVAILTARNKI